MGPFDGTILYNTPSCLNKFYKKNEKKNNPIPNIYFKKVINFLCRVFW